MQNTPEDVLDMVKKVALEEWPSDFEMQKFRIGNQVRAYHELEEIKRSVRKKTNYQSVYSE